MGKTEKENEKMATKKDQKMWQLPVNCHFMPNVQSNHSRL